MALDNVFARGDISPRRDVPLRAIVLGDGERGVRGKSFRIRADLSSPTVAFRSKWLFGPDLRDRLVPAARAGDWLVYRFARHPAGSLHGRAVPGQSCAIAGGLHSAPSATRLRSA